MSAESGRFVEQVFRYLDGEEQAVMDWLCALGCTITIPGDKHRAPVLRGVTGITGSLSSSDPVNTAVMMAMLVLGEWWPFVVPRMLDEINAEWRARGGKLRKKQTTGAKDVQTSFFADGEALP